MGRNAIMNSFNMKLPIFKGSKKVDRVVRFQVFEQWARLKGVDSDEYEDYFPTTLKESAQKWYYHYPPKKLSTYQQTKMALLLRFRDERTNEYILCVLGKMKQKETSVRRYVEKLKDLIQQLEAQPSHENLRAWFLNGSNNKILKSAEITNATTSFKDLVARVLKMEASKKRNIEKLAVMKLNHQQAQVQRRVRNQLIWT